MQREGGAYCGVAQGLGRGGHRRARFDLIGEAGPPTREPRGRSRIDAGEVDLVADEHQVARFKMRVNTTRGIGHQNVSRAHPAHQFRREQHGFGDPFVPVTASATGEDAEALFLKENQLSRVTSTVLAPRPGIS